MQNAQVSFFQKKNKNHIPKQKIKLIPLKVKEKRNFLKNSDTQTIEFIK